MANQERIVKALYAAVDKTNRQLPKGIVIDKSMDAALYGISGKLESLDFVTFIIEVESQLKREFNVDVVLVDENLLSKEKSPLNTLGALTKHLAELLKEHGIAADS